MSIPPPEPHPGYGTGARLWMLRHAEVEERWRGHAYGDLDVELSPRGREVTAELARSVAALPVDAVLSSPLARALDLGRAIAEEGGAPLRVEPGLREIHRGSWQGRRVADLHGECPGEVEAFYADPWTFTGHGGESDEMLVDRVWPVVEGAVLGWGGGVVALATHYNAIRVVVGRALGVPPPRSFALRIDPGRCALLEDAEGGWVLRRLNVAEPRAAEGVG